MPNGGARLRHDYHNAMTKMVDYEVSSGNTVDDRDTIPNADLKAETAVNMELA